MRGSIFLVCKRLLLENDTFKNERIIVLFHIIPQLEGIKIKILKSQEGISNIPIGSYKDADHG